jgi:hypothetical protein
MNLLSIMHICINIICFLVAIFYYNEYCEIKKSYNEEFKKNLLLDSKYSDSVWFLYKFRKIIKKLCDFIDDSKFDIDYYEKELNKNDDLKDEVDRLEKEYD